MNFCDELKVDLRITQNIFEDFKNAVSKKNFVIAKSDGELLTPSIDHLRERAQEHIPPPELVRVEIDTNLPDEFMFAYFGNNRLQCQAYNLAIDEILEKKLGDLRPRLTTKEAIGHMTFKCGINRYTGNTDKRKRLIPEFHKLAEKKYKKLLKEMRSKK